MSARTKARKRAVDALFAADLRGSSAIDLLNQSEEFSEDKTSQSDIFKYARECVLGTQDHLGEIDDALNEHAHGWKVDRMPALDRAILRLATWEILYNQEIPDAVAIDEAIEMAKDLSTDNSASFINGVLGKVVSTRRAL